MTKKYKKSTGKKRKYTKPDCKNPQDATMRNINALKKRIKELEDNNKKLKKAFKEACKCLTQAL